MQHWKLNATLDNVSGVEHTAPSLGCHEMYLAEGIGNAAVQPSGVRRQPCAYHLRQRLEAPE